MKEFLQQWASHIEWERILSAGIRIVVMIGVAFLVFKLVNRALHRIEVRLLARDAELPDGSPSEDDKRIQTLVRLTRQAFSIVLWIVVCLIVLTEFGIDMRPVLAGAGIVGLAVGFGAQNLVRDVISGFFMILENQVRVGDTAVINGTAGVVEQINMRTVVLRDVSDVVHVFPSGSITTLSNQTMVVSAYVFDVGVEYTENVEQVSALIAEILVELKNDPVFGPTIVGDPEIFGVDRFVEFSFVIRGRIRTLPGNQWAAGREFLRRVKMSFERNNIKIPLPHRTLMLADQVLLPAAESVLKKRSTPPTL